MYAIFDDAVRRFFMRATHLGNPVPAIFARPDRAHTEYAERMRLRLEQAKKAKALAPGFAPTTQNIEDRPAAVPFMSVWVQPAKFDPSRYSPATFRGITKDLVTGNATSVRFPRPMVSDVQVDLWCGDDGGELIAKNIEAQIEEQFLAESVYLPIDYTLTKWYKPPFNTMEHARAYGQTRVRLIGEPGWADSSELEEGGDGPKETRRTWTGRLETYIPYRPVEGRLVLTVRIGVYDVTDPNTLLAESVTDAED